MNSANELLQATSRNTNAPLTPHTHQFIDDDELKCQFITFTVDNQEYGIDIMMVKEIKGWSNTTILPNTPPYMRGVINLRGTVVPILDLRKRFGKPHTEASKNHVVMITTVGARIMGILVDAVSDILMVSSEQIRPVPEMDEVKENSFLSGLVNLDNRMVALLVLEKLFDHTIEILEQSHSLSAIMETHDNATKKAPPPPLDEEDHNAEASDDES